MTQNLAAAAREPSQTACAGRKTTGRLRQVVATGRPVGLAPAVILPDLSHAADPMSSALALAAAGAIAAMALSWFRRSKKPQPEQPAPMEHTPAQRQIAPPLRIRGLLLLNLGPADGPERIETAPPLGSRGDVVAAVRAAIPEVRFDETGRGEMVNDGARLALDLGASGTVHAIVASAEGDAAVDALRALLVARGWRAYAPRAGVFVDPDGLELFGIPGVRP